MSRRPIMIAVGGDSGTGKTTLCRGLDKIFGADRIETICLDDYHSLDREQRKSVGEFIEFLTGQPGVTPQLETSPRSLVAKTVDLTQSSGADSDNDDPLLELLRTGNGLEEDEFLAELHRQRTPAGVSE